MKKLIYCFICFSIVFSSCILLPIDYMNVTNVTIVNETKFNLIIGIDYMLHGNIVRKVETIIKGEAFTFGMSRIGGRYSVPPDPNYEITNFIFSNADTSETIKEIYNNNFFKRISYNQRTYDYIFIITDDLLFLE